MYDRNTLTRVKDMNRMTRVTYLSSYLEWVSHQDFKNVAYVGFFRHFLCVFVFVVVFVIVFVFVFVSSYYFWIAFIISFQNMYGYRGLWSLRAEIMIIFEVMTDKPSHIVGFHLYTPPIRRDCENLFSFAMHALTGQHPPFYFRWVLTHSVDTQC